MRGKKRLLAGVAGVAMIGAAAMPAFAGAASVDGGPATASAAVRQDVGDGGHAGGMHRFGGPRHHRGGVLFGVLEQFGVDRAQLRDAMQTVREQFPPQSRPQVERPLTDEGRAALEAYAAARNAALAEALGIDQPAFQAAIDAARDARRQQFEAHRATRQQALAEALGITVEQLQAALEQVRVTLGRP